MTEQASSFIREHGFATFVAVALGAAFWVAAQTVGKVFLDKIESYQAAQVQLTTQAIESNNRMAATLQEFQHQQTMRNMKADELSATREKLQADMLVIVTELKSGLEREAVRDHTLGGYMMHAINTAWEAQGLPKPFPDSVLNDAAGHPPVKTEAGSDK